MPERKPMFTLWTMTSDSWSAFLEDAQLTAEVTAEVEKIQEQLGDFERRLEPYETPVTDETLCKSVG